MSPSPSRIFAVERPRAVPGGAGRMRPQVLNALHQHLRRTVARLQSETALEGELRLVPFLQAIQREPGLELIAQLGNLACEAAAAREELEDGDGFRLAHDAHAIELADLDGVAREGARLLRDEDRRAEGLIRALQARGEIRGIADHRVAARILRPDTADGDLARGDAHARADPRHVAAQ